MGQINFTLYPKHLQVGVKERRGVVSTWEAPGGPRGGIWNSSSFLF